MDSANISHNKPPLQDQLVCSSTTLDTFSYAAAGSPPAWTPNNILCNASFASYSNEALLNLRNPRLQNDMLAPSLTGSMTKGLGLDWNTTSTANFSHNDHHSSNPEQLQLSRIKRKVFDPYERFGEMINSPSSGIDDVFARELRAVDDSNLKLLLRTLSRGGESSSSGIQSCLEECCFMGSPSPAALTSKRLSCSQIYPTVNVSELMNHQHGYMGNSSAFGVNLQALDLFNLGRFGGSFRQPFQEQVVFSKNSCLPHGLDFTKPSVERPMVSGTNVEIFSKGVAESKRADVNSEPKAAKTQVGRKRSRLEYRACPPFKVRKEKLGDRIAALQQLIAPFGKTDTASVLMEAIGYIKFLQNQVETLSVPYLKSSRHKNSRAVVHGGCVDNGGEERKRDLRSRGLCLVPWSCLTYVTDGGGGGMWPPPHHG